MEDTYINKRKSRRIPFNQSVYYAERLQAEGRRGVITQLSNGGLFIKDSHVLQENSRVYMTIYVDDKTYEAEGTVAWTNDEPPMFGSLVENGMGIKFDKVDARLLMVYKQKLEFMSK